ncbi:hypothetical protein FQA39_LY12499 [Lamprigera yunnana]|nr:hypothetical protein FQA39_LY12499 [Lamprigera yunnana]
MDEEDKEEQDVPIIEELIIPEECTNVEKINVDKKKKKRKDKQEDDDGEMDDEDGERKDEDEGNDEEEDKKDEAVSLPIPDDEVEVKPTQGFNSYAANKNAAQGMMDIALITANANQLRYMLAYNRGSSTYIINLFLVSLSLLLQIAVGIGLVLKTKLDKKDENEKKVIRRINSFNVIGVLLITITNVFIASFTVTPEYSPSTDKTGSHSTS